VANQLIEQTLATGCAKRYTEAHGGEAMLHARELTIALFNLWRDSGAPATLAVT
jgi:hypothetical protein